MNHALAAVLSFRCVALRSGFGNTVGQYSKQLMKPLILLFCLFSYTALHAEKVFDFNTTCQQAYLQISSLKLTSGAQMVAQARRENPDNLIPEILDSYIDFYILFFNENPDDFQERMPHFDDRLDKLEEGPGNSPFYNYCRTVIYMQKACVEIKFGKQWSAGWDFRRAFNLVKENRKKYPSFLLNNMIYGPMEIAAGTIPSGYKWLASLFGIKGSIKDGIALMHQFVNSNDSMARLFFSEASFYYCYMMYYIQNKPEDVFQYVNQKKLDVVNNHLLAYMVTNLAINNKQTAYAKNIILKRNQSPEYLSTSIWDFELAYAQMHHLEIKDAVSSFQNFVARFKGKFYVKDAYEKLSWCYYLQGNETAAENARQQVIQKGSLTTDADKQAYKNAKQAVWPNMLLLKTRLLNDGGYNNEALLLLNGKSVNDFDKTEEKLEFAYRVGRIYDDIGKDDEAIKMYLYAIKLGANRTEYYAARAALQIGWIYERQGKMDLAVKYFQQCLDLKDHDYKDSLDQKAKAGIARCSGN